MLESYLLLIPWVLASGGCREVWWASFKVHLAAFNGQRQEWKTPRGPWTSSVCAEVVHYWVSPGQLYGTWMFILS